MRTWLAKDCRKVRKGLPEVSWGSNKHTAIKYIIFETGVSKTMGPGPRPSLGSLFFTFFLSFVQLIFFMFFFYFIFFLAKPPIFRVLHQWCIIAISSHIKEMKCVRWSSFFQVHYREDNPRHSYIHIFIHTSSSFKHSISV